MQIEVSTISRQQSTVGQSPAAVFVITRDMIRSSGATTLPELLRIVPGVVVARIDGNKWAVSARGFNDRFGNKLLVQIDGRSVYNPLFSGVYWDAVDYPLEDIERIEVVRGPGASVWGANAVNGIIQIITKEARDTQGGFFSAGSGTDDRGFGSIRYGGTIEDKGFYRAYAKGFERDEQFSRAGDPNDQWWGANGGLRLDWQATETDMVTFQGNFLVSEAGRKDVRPLPTAPFVLTNVETEVTHGADLLARWSRQCGDDCRWTLQAYWDRVDRQGDQGFVDVRWDTVDVDFQSESALGRRQRVVYGIALRYVDAFLGPSTQDGGFAVSFPPADRVARLFSLFVQDQIALVQDELVLTLGSKFEHNDFTGFETQPSVRALWTPTTRDSVWTAVSRAVRTPNLSEDGIGSRQVPSFPPAFGGAPLFAQLTGNLDFQSEEMLAYEIGYRAQTSERLALDLALFFNDYDDLRVAVPGAPTSGTVPGTFDLPLSFQNRMRGETYGAELSVQWQVDDSWRVSGAYSLLEMNLQADESLMPSVIAGAEAAEGQSPEQQVVLQSSWRIASGLQLDLAGRFVDRLHGFNPAGGVAGGDVIKDYLSLDANLSWTRNEKLELALVARNLLAQHHPETGTAQFLRSSPVEMRRAVSGHVRFRW